MFLYLLSEDVPFPIFVPTLVVLLFWCCVVIFVPIISCKKIAPRHKPASILLGIVLIVLMVLALSNSAGFPTFVLVMHILTTTCLVIGTTAAFVDNKTLGL